MRGAWVTGASWHDTTRAAHGASLAGVADPSGAIPGPMVAALLAGLCEAEALRRIAMRANAQKVMRLTHFPLDDESNRA